jgi:hypothetical protein
MTDESRSLEIISKTESAIFDINSLLSKYLEMQTHYRKAVATIDSMKLTIENKNSQIAKLENSIDSYKCNNHKVITNGF